jgi:hypothetical protein
MEMRSTAEGESPVSVKGLRRDARQPVMIAEIGYGKGHGTAA